MAEPVEAALERLGIPREAIDRAVERGDPVGAIFESVLLPGMAERTVTAREIDDRGGLTLEQIARVQQATGLPIADPDEPAFTEREAQSWIALGSAADLWPEEIILQVARVYGRLLARIAQTEVQLFRVYVERKLLEEADDEERALAAVRSSFAYLLPSAEPVIAGIHRRWVEHELAQVAVGRATGPGDHVGAVEASFVFCDLKDFTAYSEQVGDTGAIAAIDHFGQVVSERRSPAKLAKALGDGYMLVYGDPVTGVEAATHVIRGMRDFDGPRVHASVHHGSAILREGDYFGGSVNLAARMLAWGGPDELVVTRDVLEVVDGDFIPIGAQSIPGVSWPVPLFRLLVP